MTVPEPTGHPTREELAAWEELWSFWLRDPEIYDDRAGGSVVISGFDTADVLRDGLRLLAAVRDLTAEVERQNALNHRLMDHLGDKKLTLLDGVYEAGYQAGFAKGNPALVAAEDRAARLEAALRGLRQYFWLDNYGNGTTASSGSSVKAWMDEADAALAAGGAQA